MRHAANPGVPAGQAQSEPLGVRQRLGGRLKAFDWNPAPWIDKQWHGSLDELVGHLVEKTARGVIPEITGRAWITGTAQYLLDPSDPFPAGFAL